MQCQFIDSGVLLMNADRIFHLVAIVIAGSISLHSSTDVLVARRFHGDSSDGPARIGEAEIFLG